eukprot:4390986-Amphidinium_carterae.1
MIIPVHCTAICPIPESTSPEGLLVHQLRKTKSRTPDRLCTYEYMPGTNHFIRNIPVCMHIIPLQLLREISPAPLALTQRCSKSAPLIGAKRRCVSYRDSEHEATR